MRSLADSKGAGIGLVSDVNDVPVPYWPAVATVTSGAFELFAASSLSQVVRRWNGRGTVLVLRRGGGGGGGGGCGHGDNRSAGQGPVVLWPGCNGSSMRRQELAKGHGDAISATEQVAVGLSWWQSARSNAATAAAAGLAIMCLLGRCSQE